MGVFGGRTGQNHTAAAEHDASQGDAALQAERPVTAPRSKSRVLTARPRLPVGTRFPLRFPAPCSSHVVLPATPGALSTYHLRVFALALALFHGALSLRSLAAASSDQLIVTPPPHSLARILFCLPLPLFSLHGLRLLSALPVSFPRVGILFLVHSFSPSPETSA